MVNFLISQGCDLNLNIDGYTPLHLLLLRIFK
ncbi:hypothetical protein LIT25_27280 (plasmid) [Bacillus sp. F19]|nr:hypothetical protein LIT25_27280 [Bacillus sp. F19]